MHTDEFSRLPEEFGSLPREYSTLRNEFSPNYDEFNIHTEVIAKEAPKASAMNQKLHTMLKTKLIAQTFAGILSIAIVAAGPKSALSNEEITHSLDNLNIEVTEDILAPILEELTVEVITEPSPSAEESQSKADVIGIIPSKPSVISDEDGKESIFFNTITCPSCEGVGIYCPGDPTFGFDRGNGSGYAGCGGTGYSPCPDSWCHNGVRTCEICRGTGMDHDDFCPKCNGSGIMDCDFCGNTGIAPCISAGSHVNCEYCGGSGSVFEEATAYTK